MTNSNQKHSGPLVSVLISTYNRPGFVREAVASIFRQTYPNFEIILVRDGGTPVGDIAGEFGDERLVFIDREQNQGKPYSLNEAIDRAKGKYVCYLDDDDIYYPNHIEALISVLEGQEKYQVAYSDLYKAHCRIEPDGRRVVLSKNIEVTRDFNRMLMLQFNHALHVSLMHRRDLFEKTGKYNEELNVMIDWDLTRKLVFYTDFLHVPKITGEFYSPVPVDEEQTSYSTPAGDCDRISVQRRKNVKEFMRNLLTIRSTRPPGPWPKVKDLSIILLAESPDESLRESLRAIWMHSFYPHQIYVPLPREEFDSFCTVVPNVLGVPIKAASSQAEKFDAALKCCEGDYVAYVPSNYSISVEGDERPWIETALQPLLDGNDPDQAFELLYSNEKCWAAVLSREQIERARKQYRHLGVRESVTAAGIRLRKPQTEEFPLQFDCWVIEAEEAELQGDWARAVEVFEYLAQNYQNELWMKTRWANTLYHAGRYDEALSIAEELNLKRPTVSTLLIEARIHRKRDDVSLAIEQFEKAEDILQGSELAWSH